MNIGLTNLGWIETNSDKLSKDVLPASWSYLIASIEISNKTGKIYSNYFKNFSSEIASKK